MPTGKDIKIDTSTEAARQALEAKLAEVSRGDNRTGVVREDVTVTGRDGTFKA
jgi:hypothetical protein